MRKKNLHLINIWLGSLHFPQNTAGFTIFNPTGYSK
ncbi:GSCOCG00009318001-RA-CDS [Cotesia congregata]|nr:GSCOCG00009318001-RA-CDS [Cotesia congregata]